MIKSSMRCFPWWAPGWCSAGHRGGEAAPWGAPSHGTDPPPPAPLTFLPIDRRLLVYVELRRVGFCKEKGGWGTGIGSSWLWKGACPDTLVCTGAQATRGGVSRYWGTVPGRWKCCTLLRAELLPWREVGCGALPGVRLSSHSRMTCGQAEPVSSETPAIRHRPPLLLLGAPACIPELG